MAAREIRAVAEETIEHRRQLRFDVRDLDELLVELRVAVLAVPLEPVTLALAAHAFDHEADGVRGAARGVRQVRRQQEDLSLADRNVDTFALLHRRERDAALELIEEFLA